MITGVLGLAKTKRRKTSERSWSRRRRTTRPSRQGRPTSLAGFSPRANVGSATSAGSNTSRAAQRALPRHLLGRLRGRRRPPMRRSLAAPRAPTNLLRTSKRPVATIAGRTVGRARLFLRRRGDRAVLWPSRRLRAVTLTRRPRKTRRRYPLCGRRRPGIHGSSPGSAILRTLCRGPVRLPDTITACTSGSVAVVTWL